MRRQKNGRVFFTQLPDQLMNLPEETEKELAALRPDEDVPAWAFRFLQSIEGVTMIL